MPRGAFPGQAGFVEGHLSRPEWVDFLAVDIEAQDVEAHDGHADRVRRTQIPGTDHRDFGRAEGLKVVHWFLIPCSQENSGAGFRFPGDVPYPVQGRLERPCSAWEAVLLQWTTLSRTGFNEYPKPGPLTSAVFSRKTFPVPQPSRISCVWNPSKGEFLPVFLSIRQPLPLTSTQESASWIDEPSKLLLIRTPSEVPSLISTLSAVVPEMVFVPDFVAVTLVRFT